MPASSGSWRRRRWSAGSAPDGYCGGSSARRPEFNDGSYQKLVQLPAGDIVDQDFGRRYRAMSTSRAVIRLWVFGTVFWIGFWGWNDVRKCIVAAKGVLFC